MFEKITAEADDDTAEIFFVLGLNNNICSYQKMFFTGVQCCLGQKVK